MTAFSHTRGLSFAAMTSALYVISDIMPNPLLTSPIAEKSQDGTADDSNHDENLFRFEVRRSRASSIMKIELFHRLDSPQHREVDGIGHRFVADRARVQIVAGMIPITKTRWMVGIADGLIEIEAAVSCAAGPDPLIDRRANGFPVLGVVVCAFIRQ